MKETMSNNVTYTREVAVRVSELVDEVYYNENTRELYVDLDDAIYKYSDVPVAVVDEFEKAKSAGTFYNQNIKGKYTSENLGTWLEVDYDEVEVEERTVGFADGGFIASDGSAHFNMVGPNTIDTVRPNESVISKETVAANKDSYFSLSPFKDNGVAKVEGVERDYAVTFEVDGLNGRRTHTLKSDTVDNAVEAVLELGKMLELNFVVREVTIKFE